MAWLPSVRETSFLPVGWVLFFMVMPSCVSSQGMTEAGYMPNSRLPF
jgi:hypothetical protein